MSKLGWLFWKFKNSNQRQVILQSKLESIALYAAPLVFKENANCIKRLESLLMKINKFIYNKNTYMKRYEDICQDIRVELPAQKLLKLNTRFICKLMFEKRVVQIIDFLIINPRTGTKIYLADPQKTSSRSAIIRLISLYNALPLELKLLNPDRLKRKLSRLQVSVKDWYHDQSLSQINTSI